ncbi:MAG: S41 family peptidase, partial [Saprospiraceae bacterium]|nr:S41 family peptidase [Saprospiraceae bacterium]
MKYYSILLFLLSIQILGAQEAHLSYEYKKEVIGRVSELITEFYIYPDVAEKAAVDLQERLEAGEFNEFEEDASFAIALTEVLQGTTKDKHLRVMSQNNYRSAENALEGRAEQRMDQINSYRTFNQGFMGLRLLEGNVAYLDLRGFAPLDRARETTDAYMKLMSQADAVIIDLTHNGGGDPSTVQ